VEEAAVVAEDGLGAVVRVYRGRWRGLAILSIAVLVLTFVGGAPSGTAAGVLLAVLIVQRRRWLVIHEHGFDFNMRGRNRRRLHMRVRFDDIRSVALRPGNAIVEMADGWRFSIPTVLYERGAELRALIANRRATPVDLPVARLQRT
jgi:hypothetical protein